MTSLDARDEIFERFRARFPIFREKAFMDSCSKGALSDAVEGALSEYLRTWREEGSPWETWGRTVDEARGAFARLIGADLCEVAVSYSASIALSTAASALRYKTRNKVVLGTLEFPTMGHVWLAQQKAGARVLWVREQNEQIPPEAYRSAVDEQTLIVPVSHVSYRNGSRSDIDSIAAIAHSVGAYVLVDAYQSVGTVPINVKDSEVDFLVAGCNKYLLGVPGIAFLYVRQELIRQLEPLVTGWQAQTLRAKLNPEMLEYAEDAKRFHSGTQAAQNAYASIAGMRLIEEMGVPVIHSRIADLTQNLIDGARGLGLEVFTPADAAYRGALVAVKCADPPAMVAKLRARGVIVSWRGQGIRLSLHVYNNRNDIETALDILAAHRGLMLGE
jgi:selenocysteine lyase/cysteine desulfurase